MHSNIARFCSETQVLRFVPKAPLNIAAYICIGSSPVKTIVTTAQIYEGQYYGRRPDRPGLYQGSAALLEMCMKGT